MKKQSFEDEVASRVTSKVFSELAYRDMDHTISEFALQNVKVL